MLLLNGVTFLLASLSACLCAVCLTLCRNLAVAVFGQADGNALHVRNWSELWTEEHLQKRLLEPLQGVSLAIIDGGSVAVLEFESDRVAARAQLICRAAAKAAEENMRQKSRTASPPWQPPPSDKSVSGRVS